MSVDAKINSVPNSNPSKKNSAPMSKHSAKLANTDPSLASLIQNNLRIRQNANETPVIAIHGSSTGMKSSHISSGC